MEPLTSTTLDPDAPLRHAVDRMQLVLEQADAAPSVLSAWRQVRDVLALHDAPALRGCPSCGAVIMREARRCGHCWNWLPHEP